MTRHPQHDAILQLLNDGQNNREIARQLHVAVRTVAAIRQDAGLPPTPRSAWTRKPHPQADTIRSLLGEGHTDVEIRRRTGADVGTIARMRKAGGYGPATITRPRGRRTHRMDAQIREQLTQGLSAQAVARVLGVDRAAVRRIRDELGLPPRPAQPLSLDEKWEQRAKPVEGGHREWTGGRVGLSRTPVMAYRGKTYTAASLAFRRRTGRDPVGQVKAECGMQQCVAPEHVEDEPGRMRLREQLRHLLGMGERPQKCAHGHAQAEHGRLLPGGVAYCQVCQAQRRTASKESS
ncbi:helix-turn-helix domain-containing protein [Streptomyces longwoodensis]|uniref:helix-turn-helix domain-containing protein n=1 Tax=Streptomyces longwoodensis TaxID=68231 RepID=UPI00224FE040|nr:helix-turn-helix domain-containing protein [Streptomyces longwoodensis]MCX4993809.1 hypothetical protein [Streptomyces longwoodensis]MCX4998071.1 hypothetical protein [Streptomyces longwoodensis]